MLLPVSLVCFVTQVLSMLTPAPPIRREGEGEEGLQASGKWQASGLVNWNPRACLRAGPFLVPARLPALKVAFALAKTSCFAHPTGRQNAMSADYPSPRYSNRAVEGTAKRAFASNSSQFGLIFSLVPQSLYDCAVPPLRFDGTGTLRETEVLRCVSMQDCDLDSRQRSHR
ncbi:MAG: hypothetical protein JWQ49_1777 [Edaphobacter sp.]|nr:hypothetical protein [Edaphobacter sp.]